MDSHDAPRRPGLLRGLRSTRVRVLLATGMLLGLNVPGTLAYWTDSATVAGGTFSSGTLDMTLDGNQGNPEAWTNSVMTLGDMVPGESFAASFPVRNDGTVAFTYTATGTASGDLAPELSFQAVVGGDAASNATVGGLRTGTCAGGTAMVAQTLDATPRTVVGTAQELAAGASQSVCLLVTLSTAAPGSAQGQSATGTLVFAAKQLGAP
jgi:predicted ribosomally synthesized peptide with SipW-like signal peptide